MSGQVVRFGSVGLVVTATDFIVLNFFLLLGLPVLMANLIAVSCAMTLSFWLNRAFVFDGDHTSARTVALFIGGTIFSLYGLQSLILHLMTHGSPMADSLIYANLTKLLATAVSATFNFIYYKKVVFVER